MINIRPDDENNNNSQQLLYYIGLQRQMEIKYLLLALLLAVSNQSANLSTAIVPFAQYQSYRQDTQQLQEEYPQQPRFLCGSPCTCFLGICSGCISNQYYRTGLPLDCYLCTHEKPYCKTCSKPLFTLSCTGCIDATAYLQSGSCYLCSSAMPNCVTCSSATHCLTVPNASYFIGTDNLPYFCPALITNCVTCSTTGQCLTVPNASYFIGTDNLVYFCPDLIPHCVTCSSATQCLTVPNASYFIGTDGLAYFCPDLIPNCLTCSSATFCLTVLNASYFIDTDNLAYVCADVIPNCVTCSGATFCLTVLNASYFIDTDNLAYVCADVIPNCVTCSGANHCLTVVSTRFYLGTDNMPHSCGSQQPNCATCTANPSFSCSTCEPGYILGSGSCAFCQDYMDKCFTCTSPTNCVDCVVFYYVAPNNSACLPCPSLPNCYDCSGPSTCEQCVDDTFYVNSTGVCTLCGVAAANCSRCTAIAGGTSANCNVCDVSFFLNVTICQSCSSINPKCLQCSDLNTCTLCQTGYCAHSRFCSSCSIQIPNCDECSSCSICTLCTNENYYLAGGGLACLPCAFSLPGCANCSNSTICLDCFNNSYFMDNNSQCNACSSQIDECWICENNNSNSSNITCLGCFSATHFVNDTGHCQSCADVIPYCHTCTDETYCITCINNSYAFYSPTVQCKPCSFLYQGCSLCNSVTCTTCRTDFALHNGGPNCSCIVGWMVKELCTSIVGCIDPIDHLDGSKGCLSCNTSQFFWRPVGNACQCLQGVLAGTICITVFGCISALTDINAKPYCVWCNTTAGFQGIPVQGVCSCGANTIYNGSFCVEVCGDGFLASDAYECDDGNIVDGDGCSSLCTVEVGYRCDNGSSTTPSVCYYVGVPLKLSLSSVKKNGILNEGIFEFAIYPPMISLSSLDLINHIILGCDSTYTLTQVTYSSGILRLEVDYTEDLEGRQCSLQLDFNGTTIVSPPVSLSFLAVSSTMPLILTRDPSMITTSALIFQALSYAALAFFALSLSHKTIGAEIIFTFQMVYLSNCAYNQLSLFSYTMQDVGWVTGGWPLSSPILNSDVPFLRDRVALSKHFLNNSLFVTAVLFLAVLLWAVLLSCRSSSQQQPRKHSCFMSPRAVWLTVKLYTNLIFPVSAGFFATLFLAAFLNGLRSSNSSSESYLLAPQANSFGLLLCFAAMTTFFLQFFCSGSKQLQGQMAGLEGAKKWYIPVFLLKLFFVVLLLQAGVLLNSFEYVAYALLGVLLAHFLVTLFGQPYDRVLFNLSVLFCDFTQLYAVSLPVCSKFFEINDSLQMYTIYATVGLLALNLILGVVRLIVIHCSRSLTEKNAEEEAKRININKEEKQKHAFLYEQQMVFIDNRYRNPYSVFNKSNHLNPLQCREDEEEQHIVTELKQKLREDLFLKKINSNLSNPKFVI